MQNPYSVFGNWTPVSIIQIYHFRFGPLSPKSGLLSPASELRFTKSGFASPYLDSRELTPVSAPEAVLRSPKSGFLHRLLCILSPEIGIPVSRMVAEKIELRRQITLPYASAIMIGIIIGSGIFVSPISFVINCGSVGASLIMWVVSGLLTLFVALCFNELGGIYPDSGGEYNFLKHVVGRPYAFLCAWMHLWIIQPSFYALLALTATDYIFYAMFPDCGVPQAASIIASSWIIGLFSGNIDYNPCYSVQHLSIHGSGQQS